MNINLGKNSHHVVNIRGFPEKNSREIGRTRNQMQVHSITHSFNMH